MGDIVFQNTLGGEKQTFVPLETGRVRMYTCGPTVYDFAHIGNFRTFVFQDILRRFLRSRGFEVTQVTNFTDVDDRIIAKAAEANVDIRQFTDKYIDAFLADQRVLGIGK
ncbi:MAG TPA: class I tRNA ligase family protein, partial [Terriglobales bacterium]|nr:class I tRNA ligase family protein [Terriglobales bacterium]